MLVVILLVFGLVLGSFAGAQVWRLRARQLVEDKASGEEYDRTEYKRLVPRLTRAKTVNDRSKCLDCGHELRWYDLLPLISWLSTGGRCRYCHNSIGWFEPAMELGVAAVFVVSYLAWPFELGTTWSVATLTLWLLACVALAALFAYDAKWFLLPDIATLILVIVALGYASIRLASSASIAASLASLAGSLVILSGIYAVLYYYSRSKYGDDGVWVGFGDVKLGIGLGLLAFTWQQAFLALFLANFIGVILVLPGLITGKISRKSHIPLGPLLIVGTIGSVLWGNWLIGLLLPSVVT